MAIFQKEKKKGEAAFSAFPDPQDFTGRRRLKAKASKIAHRPCLRRETRFFLLQKRKRETKMFYKQWRILWTADAPGSSFCE
jgi:hypothetical protein